MNELEQLVAARRNGEIIKAMVRSVGTRRMPIYDEEVKKMVTKEVECAIFELDGGVKGLCPMPEFSEHKFNSLIGFVGTVQELLILELDTEEKIAVVSVRLADKFKRKDFWDKLTALEKEDKLKEQTFDAVVTGLNMESQTVFAKVEGQNCFIKKADWDYVRRNLEDVVVRNSTIQVKVIRFDRENNLVQVSRKATLEDPLEMLKQFKADEAVVGRVTAVHPIHGVFVQLLPGLQIKAVKPKYLDAPVMGDIVKVKIHEINEEKRHAYSVIIGFVEKKKRKDLGSFLYE